MTMKPSGTRNPDLVILANDLPLPPRISREFSSVLIGIVCIGSSLASSFIETLF